MMRSQLHCWIIAVLFIMPCLYAHEFVKTKTKKESSAHIKEDIAELLESALRQLGRNIQESVEAQKTIFDKIKDMLSDNQQSTSQLKELREYLEKYLKKFEEQQADLQSFLLKLT